MFTLSSKNQWLVGGALLLAMLITRGHVTDHLQDASWAIFFMAGFYLRNSLAFVPFMLAAAAIDYVAITQFGVSSFCVSSAYVALIPAYGALYAAGRWLAGHYRETPAVLFPLAASLLIGIVVCELVSSGSFYFFSERFADTNLVEFAGRLVQYLPHGLAITSFYVGVGALLHVAVRMAQGHSVHGH